MPLFSGFKFKETRKMIEEREVSPLKKSVEGFPDDLSDLIEHMLQKKQETRPPSSEVEERSARIHKKYFK